MKYKTLNAVYAAMPAIACQGKCQEACGPIGFFGVEADRITAAGQAVPEYHHQSLTCTALTREGRCTIYANRPLVCRLFGVTPKLLCPWGCQPERFLTAKEAAQLMESIAQLSGGRRAIAQPRKAVFEL